MFNKRITYSIIVSNRSEERDLITLFHKSDIYWISKKHAPFQNLNLQEKLDKIESMNYSFPQYINLYFNNIDNCWIYMYMSSQGRNGFIKISKLLSDASDFKSAESEITANKLIRKYKLKIINESQKITK